MNNLHHTKIIRKLCLAMTVAGIITISQETWSCDKQQATDYDYIGCLKDGLAGVKKDGKNGYIDRTGKIVIPLQFDIASGFQEGLAVVGKKDQLGYIEEGYIDKTGKVVIPLQFNHAHGFHEGLAVVSKIFGKNEKYGYINKAGKVVIPLQFDYANPFDKGLAQVLKGGKVGYINKTGKVVVPIIYDIVRQNNDIIEATRNGTTTLINPQNGSVLGTEDAYASACSHVYVGKRFGRRFFTYTVKGVNTKTGRVILDDGTVQNAYSCDDVPK